MMAWVRSHFSDVNNFTEDLSDGSVLAKLVLLYSPSMIALSSLMESEAPIDSKASRIVSIISDKLSIPPLLQLPLVPEKRVTLLFLLLLAKELHPNISLEMIEGKINRNV